MEKISEHTDGTHVYMKMLFDDGAVEEIDAYFCDGGTLYKTTSDGDEAWRAQVISAFQELY